jgi:hypothetical protein
MCSRLGGGRAAEQGGRKGALRQRLRVQRRALLLQLGLPPLPVRREAPDQAAALPVHRRKLLNPSSITRKCLPRKLCPLLHKQHQKWSRTVHVRTGSWFSPLPLSGEPAARLGRASRRGWKVHSASSLRCASAASASLFWRAVSLRVSSARGSAWRQRQR